ncbi:MAG: ATP:cob(I)alamin adenosyltransferase, partial [Dehalococcoidia bacterium]|jgi:cob(I)alamin adenosyltransferase|nr:ATP:cob(I)alamin adenosyltransferase [Dehalococcoidia bacterium]
LGNIEAVSGPLLRYINRLSDLLFAMARATNARANVDEPEWRGRDAR